MSLGKNKHKAQSPNASFCIHLEEKDEIQGKLLDEDKDTIESEYFHGICVIRDACVNFSRSLNSIRLKCVKFVRINDIFTIRELM